MMKFIVTEPSCFMVTASLTFVHLHRYITKQVFAVACCYCLAPLIGTVASYNHPEQLSHNVSDRNFWRFIDGNKVDADENVSSVFVRRWPQVIVSPVEAHRIHLVRRQHQEQQQQQQQQQEEKQQQQKQQQKKKQ